MAPSVKHKFVNAHPDGPDATLVRPSNWNDDHDILLSTTAVVLGRKSAGAGAAEELDSADLAALIGGEVSGYAPIVDPVFTHYLTQTHVEGNIWTDSPSGVGSTPANFSRLDRLFVGEACNATGASYNFGASQGSIIPTSTEGASWILRDSQLLSIAEIGTIAIAGISRVSDQNSLANGCIGVTGATINDGSGGRSWCFYGDIQHENFSNSVSIGMEINTKNKSTTNQVPTAYGLLAGPYGLTINSGGDQSYGGTSASPCNAAIVIAQSSASGGSSPWNKGLLFLNNGISGTDGTTGTGVAIEMAKGHTIRWSKSSTAISASIRSDVATTGADVSQIFSDNRLDFYGGNAKQLLTALHVSNAVNNVQTSNAVTGSPAILGTRGDDTNVGLLLNVKGTEFVRFGVTAVPNTSDGAALGTSSLMWSDLFAAPGFVLNFNNGDVTVTHSTDTLTFAGASSGYKFDTKLLVGSSAAVLSTSAGNSNSTFFGLPAAVFGYFAADANGTLMSTVKSRNTTPGSHTIVQNSDTLAEWRIEADDGTNYVRAGQMRWSVDGTPNTADMPGRMGIFTSPSGSTTPVERFRVDSKGNTITNPSGSALATTATAGFPYIPTCAGAPTGVPTSYTGAVPLIYDTTNNNFYVYNGAWKKVLLS